MIADDISNRLAFAGSGRAMNGQTTLRAGQSGGAALAWIGEGDKSFLREVALSAFSAPGLMLVTGLG